MRTILKILITAFIVVALANLLPGVGIHNYFTGILVAAVLGLLNLIVKPIIVLFTLPVTIVTLGLFLLAINAFIVLMVDGLIGGFYVDGFWWALFFSLLLSFFQTILFSVFKDKKS
ncbi:phage holin family protein [Mesonia aestuariivivens]|uniref:Phage holin family protein n=1 Tax=Mesonia aestuariivivens TaxID=2796128 RepID=A0ABS6W3H4_9FLAO|nr:phage holin family protein [Mesonia aestuariivivens]MBW2962408.1 phage holin family protein [Mesonia aestuariivivens]